jgi:hypothetical protein
LSIVNYQLKNMLGFHSNANTIIARVTDRLHSLQPGGAVYDRAMREAADTQLKACVQRIHVAGTASDGGDIGQYSSRPMYMNPKNSPTSFQPVGKTGRTVFAKTGQPHVTKYFDAGYKGFRQEAGLAADKVVLTLRGDLRDGLAVVNTAGGYGLGWADEKLSELADNLEKKYAKAIWAPTANEKIELLRGFEEKVREGIKN